MGYSFSTGQPFTSGSVGTNCSVAGPVKAAGANVSMIHGIEQPKGLFAYAKASAGDQVLYNSSTKESFNSKLYPTFGGGVGFNRKDVGFTGNIGYDWKVGIDKTTKVMSEVGHTFNAQAGIRSVKSQSRAPYVPSLFNEVGAYTSSETYSLKGRNRNFNNIGAGGYVSTDLPNNFKATLRAGVQQNDHSKLKPAVGVAVAYNF